jgi:hypothetical protein
MGYLDGLAIAASSASGAKSTFTSHQGLTAFGLVRVLPPSGLHAFFKFRVASFPAADNVDPIGTAAN